MKKPEYKIILVLLAVFLFAFTKSAPCQEPARINLNRVDTTLYPTVFLNVTVIGSDGRPLEDLKPENFQVLEKETEQKVLDVVGSDYLGAPIYVALVIDASGSMYHLMEDTRNASRVFLENLGAGDHVTLLSFAENPLRHTDFTSDTGVLHQAIDDIRPYGPTALYASVSRALDSFIPVREMGQPVNMAVVVLTDGKNNQPGTLEECVEKSISLGVPVFSIGLGRSVDEESLQYLARRTGGSYIFAPTSADLEDVYKALASQLKSQLWIKYRAKPQHWPRTRLTATISLRQIPGAGDSSSLDYVVPLQWWKLILTYVLLEIVLILACYLLFRLLYRRMNMDPVAATRLSIITLVLITGIWFWFIFFPFIPLTYFVLIGAGQALLLIIPIKLLSS